MLAPILATKLYIPPPRPNLVLRPRLIERLNEGLRRKLTLVSAPAGFGKTTLVSEWLASRELPVAWLSLDEGESDPARFLDYLVAALRTIAENIGEGLSALLQSPQPPPMESILTALLNEIVAVEDEFILVLDDYHLIDAGPVDDALAFILERLPPRMHVILVAREDPRLPLARLRARAQLTELRVADLRFNPSEAAGFLNQAMGLNLAEEDIAALEARTEGWIAGLQLAAISMQGHRDPAGFIEAFAGSHRFILDYLVEEVLQRQPEGIQAFLLRTSILDRLCGPLCDALMLDPSSSGQGTLEYLERANLFIIPLDDERRWYRYHHLFAESLRQRLLQSGASPPGDEARGAAELHMRASLWYEGTGLELEAFRHAVAADDVERAESLAEGKGTPLHFRGAVAPVLDWLASLPMAVLDDRPSLWVMYASALLFSGRSEGIEQKLQAAEAALRGADPDGATRDLVGQIASMRALLAVPRNQIETIISQSRRALEYLRPDNLPARAAATLALGLAHQLQGDRAGAGRAYAEALSISQASGNSMFALAAATKLGNLQEAENRLYLAAETYREVLRPFGDRPQPFTCEALLGLARISYQWNDLEAAELQGQQSLKLARQVENSGTLAPCMAFLAHVRLARGDAAGAAAILAEADEVAHRHGAAGTIPELVAARVLALLRQGDPAAASRLADEHGLPLCRARVGLALGDGSAALAALEPFRRQAEAKGWEDELLKALVLEAVAQRVNGEKNQAQRLLAEALALAEPGGLIRVFIDEGIPMAGLLSGAAAHGIMPGYVAKLLGAFEAEGRKGACESSLPALPRIEPLSQRELEVLQLIAQGLSNQEISERLFLALSTVKGHNLKIFGKLGAQRRTEAIARARELGLL